mgnify:CR=1 FL=1
MSKIETNKEAKEKQITKEYPLNAYCKIPLNEERIVKPKVKLEKLKSESPSEMLYREIVRYLAKRNFDYIATYRPKKTKVTKYNTPKLMDRLLNGIDTARELFWIIEDDWNGQSAHCHLMISGKNITKKAMARAMKRNILEIPYLEPIKDKEATAKYCSKYVKGKAIRDWSITNKETAFWSMENDVINTKLPHSFGTQFHPNQEKHLKHKIWSYMQYGDIEQSRVIKDKTIWKPKKER